MSEDSARHAGAKSAEQRSQVISIMMLIILWNGMIDPVPVGGRARVPPPTGMGMGVTSAVPFIEGRIGWAACTVC